MELRRSHLVSSTDVLLHSRFHHGVRTGHRLKFDSGSIDLLLLLTETSRCIAESVGTWSRSKSGSRCGTAKATSSCTESRIRLTCIGPEHASCGWGCSKSSASLSCTESSSSRFKCRTGAAKSSCLCLLSKTCGTKSGGSCGLRSTKQSS